MRTETKFAVLNCDNTEECNTLAEACRVAEDWFQENWDVTLDPTDGLDSINEQLRQAYGQGDHPDSACPVVREIEE
jgi:hypothetical protein